MDNIFKPNTHTKENCHLLVVLSLAQQPLAATCSYLAAIWQPLAQAATCSSSHLLKQPLAATCSHLQPLADTCPKWLQQVAAASGCSKWLPSGCWSKWLPSGCFFLNQIAHLVRPQCRLINIKHVLNSLHAKISAAGQQQDSFAEQQVSVTMVFNAEAQQQGSARSLLTCKCLS